MPQNITPYNFYQPEKFDRVHFISSKCLEENNFKKKIKIFRKNFKKISEINTILLYYTRLKIFKKFKPLKIFILSKKYCIFF